jgi:hypothetical protein
MRQRKHWQGIGILQIVLAGGDYIVVSIGLIVCGLDGLEAVKESEPRPSLAGVRRHNTHAGI